MKKYFSISSKQRGIAIISALLIVTVVTVIAASMLMRQSVLIRALEAEQFRAQGNSVLIGGLETGRKLLWEAHQRDGFTRLDQPWSQPIVNTQLSDGAGSFEGALDDQQGKFNLRNLLSNGHIDYVQLRSFERLCEMIGIDAELGQRISQRVIVSYPRILDASSLTLNITAGESNSRRMTSPNTSGKVIPAQKPMLRQVEDLYGIEGLSEPLLNRLGRYFSILPANTLLNSNTSSAEVLAASVSGLSLSRARALVADRDSGQWFINRGDLVNRLRLPQRSVDGLNIGITSDWFLLHGQAINGQRRIGIKALLHRSRSEIPKVVWSKVGA